MNKNSRLLLEELIKYRLKICHFTFIKIDLHHYDVN
jgi:hypothetical protein